VQEKFERVFHSRMSTSRQDLHFRGRQGAANPVGGVTRMLLPSLSRNVGSGVTSAHTTSNRACLRPAKTGPSFCGVKFSLAARRDSTRRALAARLNHPASHGWEPARLNTSLVRNWLTLHLIALATLLLRWTTEPENPMSLPSVTFGLYRIWAKQSAAQGSPQVGRLEALVLAQ
jgi:hypothetical protein